MMPHRPGRYTRSMLKGRKAVAVTFHCTACTFTAKAHGHTSRTRARRRHPDTCPGNLVMERA